MDYIDLATLEGLEQKISDSVPSLVYFSHFQCNVCKVLKPKVRELIENNFPQVMLYYVNTKEHPDMAGQFSVFAVPTIVVFFDGREYIRESRHVNLSTFRERLGKLYRVYYH